MGAVPPYVVSAARNGSDLGCGEGKLLRLLMAEKQFETSWEWTSRGVRLSLPRKG
jgi:hypothetical protein